MGNSGEVTLVSFSGSRGYAIHTIRCREGRLALVDATGKGV